MTALKLYVGYAALCVNVKCNDDSSLYSRYPCKRRIAGEKKFVGLKWHTGPEQDIWRWQLSLRFTIEVRQTIRCAYKEVIVAT